MSNTMKVWLIIALVLFLLGAVIFTISLAVNGFSWDRFIDGNYSQQTYSTDSGDYRQIIIDAKNNGIRVTLSSDERIHLTYYENEWNTYTVQDDGGVLRLQSHHKPRLVWFDFDFRPTNVELAVPAEYAGSLQLTTSNSSITASDINAATIDFRSSNDKINLSNATVSGKLVLTTTNGRIQLTNVTAPSAELKTSNDSIRVEDVFIDGDILATTTNGRIDLVNLTANTAKARTSNDSIHLSRLAAGIIDLQSSNGALKGSIVGDSSDYRIDSHTSNGSTNIDRGNANGIYSLRAYTSNDSINIEFVR